MKKFLTCFFAIAMIAPVCDTAFGAISRAIPSDSDTKQTSSAQSSSRGRATSNGRTTTSRTTVSRNIIPTTKDAPATTTRSTSAITRATAAANNKTDTSARSNLDAAVNTVGRNTRVSSASFNSSPVLRRAGITVRPSTAEVGGRAIIDASGTQTGSNVDELVRNVQSRATATKETIAEAKERLEQTAELNKSCQEQYNECMDQFCAVIDSNQKRCSCSANLTRYTKVEEAVKNANTQLNDVAQRIRYVGLSADEIRAIMTETEAEEALNKTADTSETRNMLEEIEDLIRDPTSSSSYVSDTYTGLDMDLDFSSDSSDIFSLDFLNNTSSSSFSNLRGTELYNAAKKRCNSVLTQCKNAGATTQQITGNYDLAIDKDCVAYEQGLKKMNETLTSNVRSANLMLQKARLAVLQNKNQYDAKGCIAALNTCMTDDMVCGADYSKCLDPTKRYIDENGEVVLGQDITKIKDFMAEYNNAGIISSNLSEYYNTQITPDTCTPNGACNVKYLLTKIGTKQKVTDEGLCRPVLDKCQQYTYNNDKYNPWNDVIVNYIQRAMVNIKAAQHQIISDYASTCMTDIAACYNQQVSQVNAWSSSASVTSIYNVMRGACRNVALTCAFAVFESDEDSCPPDATDITAQNTCIDNISEMFYQSLLCPDNSSYIAGGKSNNQSYNAEEIGNGKQWLNNLCRCNDGYAAWGSSCYSKCGTLSKFNQYGQCTCAANASPVSAGDTSECVCNTGYKTSEDGTSCTPDTGSEDSQSSDQEYEETEEGTQTP